MGKGNEQVYLGIGTGVEAKIDSISKNTGEINFSDKISTAPVLSFGGQFGITNQTDARIAVHLPKIIGGLGIRAGLQHSFLDSNSTINIAIGMDLGGVFSKDSIKIFGSKTEIGKETNGALNADFFIPVSIRFQNNMMLILSPRFSFNSFFIRENQFNNDDNTFKLGYPALTLGIKSRKFYFESSALCYGNKLYPQFGFARLISF